MSEMNHKVTTKNPAGKIARKRLSDLQLGESFGNVTEICRRGDMDRNSFYAWQKHLLLTFFDLIPLSEFWGALQLTQ